jgi:competence ComEA-like helix-hairpin-helix protein
VSRRAFGCAGLLAVLAATSPAWGGKGVDGVVNLNTAPVEVLGLLPGVGPAKAAQIVAYRRRRPFRTIDELVRIRGIGRKMVRALRTHLAVTGPTTATAATGPPPTAAPPPTPAVRPGAPSAARPICPRPIFVSRARTGERRERWPLHGACARPR